MCASSSGENPGIGLGLFCQKLRAFTSQECENHPQTPKSYKAWFQQVNASAGGHR